MAPSDIKWHGWAKPNQPDVVLAIGTLPDRSRIGIYIQSENKVAPLGYFNTEEDAYAAMRSIDALLERDGKIVDRWKERFGK